MYEAAFYLCSNDELKKTQSIQNARLSFQSSESGPPPLSPARECRPYPFWVQGDTLACGVGGGGPNSDEGTDNHIG